MNGQDITFDVDSKPVAGYLALPTQTPAPGVIVLHAWWGLNQTFKKLCDRLAADGFVAFAPDLHNGKIAVTPAEAEQVMSELSYEQRHAIVAELGGFMRNRPEVQAGQLSVIGFSMGVAWSMVLASEHPEDIGKVVLFYGTYSVDFTTIKADILGHFSDVDEWEPIKEVREMEAGMRLAGVHTDFHIYPGKSHWFFEDDRPEFDAQVAETAWKRTLAFLHK
jgi:carboxymethylenebutenolidase